MISDTELRHLVEDELAWEPSVDSRNIGVAVKNGVVTLTGQTTQYHEKLTAADVTKCVSGVRGVADDIEVHLPGSPKKSDTDIANAVVDALKSNASVPQTGIKPLVKGGHVTLEGNVEWQYQKEAAASAISQLDSIRHVINLFQIKPKVSPQQIERKIESAFQRSAALDAREIKVATQGDEVTLSGTVHSWVERDHAVAAAWKAPGVTRVNDKLTVSL